MECIFCKSINKEIPSKVVYEDDIVLGILDIYPAALGHILLMPKKHNSSFIELDEKIVNHLGIIASRLALLLVTNLKAQGISLVIKEGSLGGQRSNHTLMHIIPRFDNDSLNFDLLGNDKGNKVETKKLYEDSEVLAVNYPTLTQGHIAILPKGDYSILMKVPEKIVGKMFLIAQKFVSNIVNNKEGDKKGANIIVNVGVDQPQPTVSLHVITREESDNFDFIWDMKKVEDKNLDDIMESFRGKMKVDKKKEDVSNDYYSSYLDRLP